MLSLLTMTGSEFAEKIEGKCRKLWCRQYNIDGTEMDLSTGITISYLCTCVQCHVFATALSSPVIDLCLTLEVTCFFYRRTRHVKSQNRCDVVMITVESACLAKLRGRVPRLKQIQVPNTALLWGAKTTLMVISTPNFQKNGCF